ALIQAFLKTDSTTKIESMLPVVKAFAATQFDSNIKISLGGGATSGVALNEVMIREKVLNIVQIMGAVFLVSALVFRSLLAGTLILVPLLAAVMVNFGIMGILGIPLQVATALVSTMAVGIGADYGIYMSYRLREELAYGMDEYTSVKKAFLSAGKATLFVSSAVAGGFGVLMLSVGYMIHVWMGFLIALAMIVSSIAALTIFPALIFTLRPAFIYKERKATMRLAPQVVVVLLAGLMGFSAYDMAKAETPSAEHVMKQNFIAGKVADSTAKSRFILFNAAGQQRIRETNGATKLIAGTTDNMRLVTFESPADVKGTKTLLVEHSQGDDDIWIYLPALKKVRRLVASNKKDAFVGTDFSYGDVIGHKVEDWNHKTVREEKLAGKDCYVVESLPKTPAIGENSGYSKRLNWIDKESSIAIKAENFDSAGKLLKKIQASDIRKVDDKNNKWQPMTMEAENVQTGTRTVLEFSNFKANVGVNDGLFTARSLEKK
ncbi:MAG TPA: outer membrane lipoprotein-sorting protein, partial [Oligoflexus sp.]|uniref:outer membrane lipoprotein-sorting protein n=1 Tax=Oligoflexus sp. TaxID=1971216 RepID=UPI002D41CE11